MFVRLDSYPDVLSEVLHTANLGGALSHRADLQPPWGIHFPAGARRAGFHVVMDGRCWAALDGSKPLELGAGDIVVFPHGAGHTLVDDPATPAIEIADVAPGSLFPSAPSQPLEKSRNATLILCGTYAFAQDGANPLLLGLPQMLHLPADQTREGPVGAAVRLMRTEAELPGAGMAIVIDRLIDLLFVYALRSWIELQEGAGLDCWFGALHDKAVGPAIAAIHHDPGHHWTVASLSERVGFSRATFARRFSRSVGEAPLAYVTRWRMTVAAKLLSQGHTVAEVAKSVGYENEFALAKAFKRIRGIAPGRYRKQGGVAIPDSGALNLVTLAAAD